jgi:hypothetical protein
MAPGSSSRSALAPRRRRPGWPGAAAAAGALLVALAGCQVAALSFAGSPDGVAADLGRGQGAAAGDALVASDLALTAPAAGAPSGAPCHRDSDCAAGGWGGLPSGLCSGSLAGASAPGGACQSPCRAASDDPKTGWNPECPGGRGVCLSSGPGGGQGQGQGQGLCAAGCQRSSDCRDGWVCAAIGPAPACVPLAASACDPSGDPRPAARACPGGLTCVAASPDASFGQCRLACDALVQSCPPPPSGLAGCLSVDRVGGLGQCFAVAGRAEGVACQHGTDCAPGADCLAGACRRYCRAGGPRPVGCPPGQGCGALPGVAFPPSLLGICSP